MSEENSAGETIGATTTIILEPARISGSTVEPSRRRNSEKASGRNDDLNWALVLGMLVSRCSGCWGCSWFPGLRLGCL